MDDGLYIVQFRDPGQWGQKIRKRRCCNNYFILKFALFHQIFEDNWKNLIKNVYFSVKSFCYQPISMQYLSLYQGSSAMRL